MNSSSATTGPMPLIILGGCDAKPGALPESVGELQPLSGYKAVSIQIHGRRLISHVIERFQETGAFQPIVIAGPAEVYRQAPVPVIDTNGSFGHNIRVAIETLRETHPEGPLAVTTCDILPELEDLRGLLEDYSDGRPCDLWFPLIRVPAGRELLGAFAWKPEYRIIPEAETEAQSVLPGHLIIADTKALRLSLLYRLVELAYRTRNRPIVDRRSTMLRRVFFGLLFQDLRNLLAFHPPTLTWTVVRNGLWIASRLQDGKITQNELETAVARIVMRRSYLRRHPERGARVPVLEGLSLAKDIDTEKEARQVLESQRSSLAQDGVSDLEQNDS
ncbi:MAG: hypothetical protein V3T77_05610 [Planctomycetota bacterium]